MTDVNITKIKNENIKEAVSLCFGKIIEDNIKVSDTILLKPNFLNDSPSFTGVTTDLRLIRSLIELLQEKGINNIYLAEAGFANTEKIFHNLKIHGLEEYGIKVINLEKAEKTIMDFPKAKVLKKMVLPRLLADIDVIINIPKLKTHCQTGVSLGIKNLFGFLYTPQRKISHAVDLDKAIVEIYTYIKTILGKKIFSIVDAIYGLEGKLGPNIGAPVKMDLLISGTDPVTTDAVCVQIMGSDPGKIRHLVLCERAGLGDLYNYNVIGESIENISKKFNMPFALPVILLHLAKLNNVIFKKLPAVRYPDRCTACSICVRACPKDCINLDGAPIINYKECIGCLCCAEGCPEKVFEYKIRNFALFIFMQKLFQFVSRIIKKDKK